MKEARDLSLRDQLEQYALYRIDVASDPIYVVKEDKDASWYVFKWSDTTGLAQFATRSNNPNISTAAVAYSRRTSLTYGSFGEVTIP